VVFLMVIACDLFVHLFKFLKTFQWKSALSNLEKSAEYVKELMLCIRHSFLLYAAKCTGFSWHVTII